MNVDEIMSELKSLGSEQTKKTFFAHGAAEPLFGVKIGDIKLIVKRIKKNHELSLALYKTGNSDARYLAGLIADENKISKNDLNLWAETANWSMISEYTVPWIAAESRFGFELAKDWILSKNEKVACLGWSCLSSIAAIKPDTEIDIPFFEKCLDLIADTIQKQPDRVKYCMNGFVISVGVCIAALTAKSKQTALRVGKVSVGAGSTSCKVPDAMAYIIKSEAMGRIGKKKKMARC